jgi:hypothetical protein
MNHEEEEFMLSLVILISSYLTRFNRVKSDKKNYQLKCNRLEFSEQQHNKVGMSLRANNFGKLDERSISVVFDFITRSPLP